MFAEIPNWLERLRAAVEKESATEIAKRLKVSRTSVSLLLSGKYPGKTDRMQARVLTSLCAVECPHTGKVLSLDDCHEIAMRRMPMNKPFEMPQWRACRVCVNCPAKGASNRSRQTAGAKE
ncbi:regulatory protein, LacI [Pandoraea anapnoica]|uniref:Regulatory protein, LacI n=1 Tax=Pandoraea anapnoica TaxID=2508301 RepID=A0A5E5A526_9BURK|nr:regulatory protein, LacI [Pandoraea iniqua]VVE68741.1 regulatory protein, LacI [Pandoraea anapnoica]